MTTPGDWLPPPPWDGPPLPGWMVRRPSARPVDPPSRAEVLEASPTPAPHPTPSPPPGPQGLGDYVLIMKRRGPNPIWAKPQQARIRKANQAAAERTRHLKGPERVVAMNAIVAQEVARLRKEEAAGA